MMSLDVAIKHYKQKARDLEDKSRSLWCERDAQRYKELSEECKYLITWLEELRNRRKADEQQKL